MAKVVITVEDLPQGKISVIATPNLATIAKMRLDGELTPAEQTAVMALREIHKAFKTAAAEQTGGLIAKARGIFLPKKNLRPS